MAARPVLLTARALAAALRNDVEAVHGREDGTAAVEAEARSISVPLRIIDDSPVGTILRVMSDEDVSLCVLGATGTNPGARPAGHVALSVLERATKPIVVVPPRASPKVPLRRVLIPIDGIEAFPPSLVAGLVEAGKADTEFVALHVFTPSTAPAIVDRDYYDIPAWAVQAAAAACPGLRPSVAVRSGLPSEAILAAAEEEEMDLIILVWGQQYLHGHGHIVEEVLARAQVPVLLVPRSKETVTPAPPLADGGVHPVDLLLVEDDARDVQLVSGALREANLANTLHVVRDGASALAFLRRQPPYEAAPRPGLIALSLDLHESDGRETLAAIKRDPELEEIPVVVAAVSPSDGDVARAYKLGANAFITKPGRFADFVDAVRSAGRFWLGSVTLPAADDTGPSD